MKKTRRRAKASDDHEAGARIFRACAVENVKGEKDFFTSLDGEWSTSSSSKTKEKSRTAPG